MEKISINEFPLETTIKIKEDFLLNHTRKLRLNKITYRDLFNSFKNNKITFGSFKDNFEPSYKNYRRLDIILKMCESLKIDLKELEKNIISYRTKKSRIEIHNPNIPVVVSPIFYMLIAHLMGDGGYIRFKDRNSIYSGYRQYNKKIKLSFLEKAQYVFGDIKFPRNYFNYENNTRIYLPSVPSLILLNYMGNINSFLSKKARLSKLLDCTKENLVAILTAFIIDEGSIDSGQIQIRLINRNLIMDIAKLCEKLDYKNSISKKSPSGMYGMYILNDGLKKYWSDYLDLKGKYPFLTLDYKETAIETFMKRKEKFWRSQGTNVTKNQILDLLKRNPLSVKEISSLLQLSRQGTKYHLDFLRQRGFINRLKARRGFIFELININKLPENKKGISRQQGFTKEKIISILKDKILSTTDISKIVNVVVNTTRYFLYDLEKKNKIKRDGKVKVDAKHYKILWKIKS